MSFWWNLRHCLQRKLSFWQLPLQPMTNISSKWQHFRFSAREDASSEEAFFVDVCNGLSPVRCQAIPWTNTGVFSAKLLRLYFSEIKANIGIYSKKKRFWTDSCRESHFPVPQRVNSLRPSDRHICVIKLTVIGSGNGLAPGRCQAIIWTRAGILLIRASGTNFSDIRTFSFTKMHLKMSAKWQPFCPGVDEPEQKWSPFDDIFRHNKSALVQVMAWHLFGDKPLSEPMVTQFIDLNMYVCFIRLQGCCQLLNLDVMVIFCVQIPKMAFLFPWASLCFLCL